MNPYHERILSPKSDHKSLANLPLETDIPYQKLTKAQRKQKLELEQKAKDDKVAKGALPVLSTANKDSAKSLDSNNVSNLTAEVNTALEDDAQVVKKSDASLTPQTSLENLQVKLDTSGVTVDNLNQVASEEILVQQTDENLTIVEVKTEDTDPDAATQGDVKTKTEQPEDVLVAAKEQNEEVTVADLVAQSKTESQSPVLTTSQEATVETQQMTSKTEEVKSDDLPQIKNEPSVSKNKVHLSKSEIADLEESKAIIANIKALNLADLSQTTQDIFNEEMKKYLKSIVGFESIFKTDNTSYSAEKIFPLDTKKITHYTTVMVNGHEQHKFHLDEHTELTKLFNERIKALQTAIAKNLLEKQTLTEITIGNDSRWNGSRYGSVYRLSEAEGSLEGTRKILDLLKVEDESVLKDSMISETPSSIQLNLMNLSGRIVVLKEEVQVYNRAFMKVRAEAYNELNSSDLVKHYTIHHAQELKKIELEKNTLQSAYDNRIKELKDLILIEKNLPGSSTLRKFQKEETELCSRWDLTVQRYNEVVALLDARKRSFSLNEKNLEIKEESKLEDFSPEYNQALTTLSEIVSLKENILLEKKWESYESLPQRESSYASVKQSIANSKVSRNNFAEKALPERSKTVEESAKTYREYIRTMQQILPSITQSFTNLQGMVDERKQWLSNLSPNSAKKSYFWG